MGLTPLSSVVCVDASKVDCVDDCADVDESLASKTLSCEETEVDHVLGGSANCTHFIHELCDE